MTVFIPTTLFGTMAAPAATFSLVIPRALWVWVHLLHCDVANQSIRPEEDTQNKPWRPIPSQRISQTEARLLRWVLVPICLQLSVICRVPAAGLALCIAIFCHNDLQFDSHWFTKNLLNVAGYTCFNIGASWVLSDSDTGTQTFTPYAHTLNAIIIMTTVHAQDFRDVEGDRDVGRQTLPTLFPYGGRLSIVLLVPLWSVFLSVFWELDPAMSLLSVALGIYVGVNFLRSVGNVSRDQIAYRNYNIWLCLVHIVPFVPKFSFTI